MKPRENLSFLPLFWIWKSIISWFHEFASSCIKNVANNGFHYWPFCLEHIDSDIRTVLREMEEPISETGKKVINYFLAKCEVCTGMHLSEVFVQTERRRSENTKENTFSEFVIYVTWHVNHVYTGLCFYVNSFTENQLLPRFIIWKFQWRYIVLFYFYI